MSPLSQQLHDARKAQKLTQAQLGERLGWAQTRVSTIESGRVDPRLSGVVQMARVVDHELMLVPRAMVPAVSAMLAGKPEEPLWSLGNEEETAR